MLEEYIPLYIHSVRDYDLVQMKAYQMCSSLQHISTSNSSLLIQSINAISIA